MYTMGPAAKAVENGISCYLNLLKRVINQLTSASCTTNFLDIPVLSPKTATRLLHS